MYAMTGLWFESALLPGGWARQVRLSASAGRIAQVTTDCGAQPGDERHALGLPGLPNLHSHAFQRGLAGLTERRGAGEDSFWSWRELMYRFLERLGPQELEALSAQCYLEMLEGGFTRVGEFHYLHHDLAGRPYADRGELAARIAAAAQASGIGLTLLPVFYAHAGFGGSVPAPRQRRFVTDPDGFGAILQAARGVVQSLPGGALGIAPHSLRAVTAPELAAVLQLAAGAVIHIHIAEQTREVDECLQWSGRRPIEWLLDAAPVDERWCLVHATHATAAELGGIAARCAVAGLCPLTEANLGDGIFPASEFLARAGRFGVGSDANVLLDAAAELRTLEYSQRLTERRRNVLAAGSDSSTGRTLFAGALAGGQQALLPGEPAGLQPGAWLDLVSLDVSHPALIERAGDELLDSWIFACGREAIDCVWRAGEKLVQGGRHRDRDAIGARYRAALRHLRA
jgi:formimidoylglutamate deiminase